MAHYAITGGAGFIGSHLAERLVREGHQVRVLDDLPAGRAANLEAIRDRVEYIHGDAADPDAGRRLCGGVEGVFHLAAIASVARCQEEPLAGQRAGEAATLNILDQARRAGVRRVVFSSSAAVYGDAGAVANREDQTPDPRSNYAVGKLAGEHYCRSFARLYPALDTASLRYFNVFGPRQDPSSPYSGVVSIFLKCAREGRAPTIFGDGLQTRDFVPVENVVEANLLAMSHRERLNGEVFNVATGESVTLLEVWQELQRLKGLQLPPAFGPARLGDIRDSRADISKARQMLDYRGTAGWQSALGALDDLERRTRDSAHHKEA